MCPLGGQCLEENIVYKATVKVEEGAAVEEEVQDKTYLGLCSTEWKERLGNHKQSFKKVKRRGETCLSSYVWELKDRGLAEGGDGLHHLLGDGRQGEALQPLHRHVQAVSSREVLDDDEAGLGGAEQPR